MTKAQKIFENETTDHAWPLTVRILVSSAILIYLFAVALPPLAGPPPASEIANVILQPFRPLIGTELKPWLSLLCQTQVRAILYDGAW